MRRYSDSFYLREGKVSTQGLLHIEKRGRMILHLHVNICSVECNEWYARKEVGLGNQQSYLEMNKEY